MASYLCYFLILYFFRCWFFILKHDSNKFPYIYSQINPHNFLLLSNYLIKMSQYPSFHYIFSILFVTYLSFHWFYLENTYYYESRIIFFQAHWEAIIKSNYNIYCCLITDPVLSYIFINFMFTWKIWIRIFEFPKSFVLSSLILCIY